MRPASPATDTAATLYGYYVNLDERGEFYADVRDPDGETVYEVRAGNSLDEDESSLIDDGYMRHAQDVSGLTEYLRSMKVIAEGATILHSKDFERALEEAEEIDSGLEP